MRMTPICLVVATAILPQAQAQSPEMPEPLAIVVDADGAPVAQVINLDKDHVYVLFNFLGDPALFELIIETSRLNASNTVYFSGDNCVGDAFISDNISTQLDRLNQRIFSISGPDAVTGTYRVFRSTSASSGPEFPESMLEFGSSTLGYCRDIPPNQIVLLTAEEILPNPLDGLIGPTLANSDRGFKVRGGTRR